MIAYVAGLSQRIRKSACAVFAPDDAVYCEPDGSRKQGRRGDPVPDGYTSIRVGSGRTDPPLVPVTPKWTDFFSRAERAAGIWAVRQPIDPLEQRLKELGLRYITSIGGTPAGHPGTDVCAMAFLDGGLHSASRDGFVYGDVYGDKILGERAFVWACSVFDVAPPRTCRAFAPDELERQIRAQAADGDAVEAAARLLASARNWTKLRLAASRLRTEFGADHCEHLASPATSEKSQPGSTET